MTSKEGWRAFVAEHPLSPVLPLTLEKVAHLL
ncbi:hypothetical protein SAMN05444920_14230 [Nonomuraea solani]|uniref:Uncharacterized protein n=1 Tax=Nonomuraea solani TaxID=1144553 RepID=A0A1H6F0Y0_9ACTN|nr:hypothetical protein SAMN05444920_14230 [Nonomuraea solani]